LAQRLRATALVVQSGCWHLPLPPCLKHKFLA
jgi:hypothetical protein